MVGRSKSGESPFLRFEDVDSADYLVFTLQDISYCTSVIFSAPMLDETSYELLETIQQEKINTVGAFSWLITQTFHQIIACSRNYFH